MSEFSIRIERMENAYEVEVPDAEQMKKNQNPKNPYSSPYKSYAFVDKAKMLEFIKSKLDEKFPKDTGDDFATSFDRATMEKD